MRLILSLLVIALSFSLNACNTVQVTSDWNSSFDFKTLKTWQFASPPAQNKTQATLYNDALFDGRVKTALDTTLGQKGYSQVLEGGGADFYVAFFRVVDKKLSVTTMNNYYGYGPGWGWGYGDGMGWGWGSGGFGSQTFVNSYKQGTLIIDITTDDGKNLLWRGTGSARLESSDSPEAAQKKITNEVQKILAKFPPPPAKKK
ncbi:MAG: hypothetical protein CL917_10260 [Deltaproteobacteria bacterium]|nr:hypothetical protein [Deltaproteobacteria bacterium]